MNSWWQPGPVFSLTWLLAVCCVAPRRESVPGDWTTEPSGLIYTSEQSTPPQPSPPATLDSSAEISFASNNGILNCSELIVVNPDWQHWDWNCSKREQFQTSWYIWNKVKEMVEVFPFLTLTFILSLDAFLSDTFCGGVVMARCLWRIYFL